MRLCIDNWIQARLLQETRRLPTGQCSIQDDGPDALPLSTPHDFRSLVVIDLVGAKGNAAARGGPNDAALWGVRVYNDGKRRQLLLRRRKVMRGRPAICRGLPEIMVPN